VFHTVCEQLRQSSQSPDGSSVAVEARIIVNCGALENFIFGQKGHAEKSEMHWEYLFALRWLADVQSTFSWNLRKRHLESELGRDVCTAVVAIRHFYGTSTEPP